MLYKEGFIINYKEGDQSLQRDRLVYKEDANDRIYTIQEGDRLTQIAFKFYGEPLKWFIIADVNEIQNPFELEAGQEIIIPNLNRYGDN